jgi:hypothetical protein
MLRYYEQVGLIESLRQEDYAYHIDLLMPSGREQNNTDSKPVPLYETMVLDPDGHPFCLFDEQ